MSREINLLHRLHETNTLDAVYPDVTTLLISPYTPPSPLVAIPSSFVTPMMIRSFVQRERCVRPVAKKDQNRERKDNVHSLGFQSVGLSVVRTGGEQGQGGQFLMLFVSAA